MAKKKSEKRDTPPESFEEALEELAEIVDDLEDGSVGLEGSLARFEEGMRLLRHCHEVLAKAEQRIEQLTGFDADGNPVTEAFESDSTIDQRGNSAGRRRGSSTGKSPAEEEDDPDGTLF